MSQLYELITGRWGTLDDVCREQRIVNRRTEQLANHPPAALTRYARDMQRCPGESQYEKTLLQQAGALLEDEETRPAGIQYIAQVEYMRTQSSDPFVSAQLAQLQEHYDI